jgi:hypothetical protein
MTGAKAARLVPADKDFSGVPQDPKNPYRLAKVKK